MLKKMGLTELVKVAQIKKHGQGFAVLFTSQEKIPKYETWICFSKAYLKHKGLDREKFREWGVSRSPTWFNETFPTAPILLIVSELEDPLEKQLRGIF